MSHRARPDAASLNRTIHARPGVGATAHVLQGRALRILRAWVEQPALILVGRGIKAVRAGRRAAVTAETGQGIVLEGHQSVDFTNTVLDGLDYEARWLLFDPSLLDDVDYAARASRVRATDASASLVPRVSGTLAHAFDHAVASLAAGEALPVGIARLRMLEVMHWLLEHRIVLRCAPVQPSVSVKVRALIAGRLDDTWSAASVATDLAMSEATLRRRLVDEGTSLTELLVEARMSTALTLLQATSRPVADIALAVGYESPSRFAVRFRQRFGFAPSAVRGHVREA